jgi:hypothetical protein
VAPDSILQVLGQWYLVQTTSSVPGSADTCAGIELVRPDNASWSSLTMVGQESSPGRATAYENHTIVIQDSTNSPSLWDQPGTILRAFSRRRRAVGRKLCDSSAHVLSASSGPNRDASRPSHDHHQLLLSCIPTGSLWPPSDLVSELVFPNKI